MIQAKESYWFTGISHFELWNRVCFHPPASLNNETICCENSEGNCENYGSTEQKIFVLELGVLESISSRKNISVPRPVQWKSFSWHFWGRS